MVADWVRAKLGSSRSNSISTEPKLWMYTGSLYDPLDGRKIANIQGLEHISLWNNTVHSTLLKIQPLLDNPNSTFDDAMTLRVAKVFCYTTLDEENPEPLRHIRVRPHSPRKNIPLDQTIALWETATTYISRGKDFFVHSEWPNGNHLWAQTKTSQKSKENREFTIFTKRRAPKSRLYMPDLTSPPTTTDNAEIVISPKRSALIQFGSGSMETKNKFGARETYSLLPASQANEKSQPTRPWWISWRRQSDVQTQAIGAQRLKYTRYGEAPPFYAPGRMCMLELEGKCIGSLQDATPFLRKLIQDSSEKFPTTYSTVSSFGSARLIPENATPKTKWGRQRQKMVQFYERVRAATSFQSEGTDPMQTVLSTR